MTLWKFSKARGTTRRKSALANKSRIKSVTGSPPRICNWDSVGKNITDNKTEQVIMPQKKETGKSSELREKWLEYSVEFV